MADGHGTWLTAAACTLAPARRPPRFGDLPPEHRKDLVRLGFLSATTFAYTLAMCILSQPIPSRSLHTHVALPHAAPARSALMEALLLEPAVVPRAILPPRSSGRPDGAAYRPAVVTEPEPPASSRRAPRRGNVFGRFFKGVWRTVS